MQYARLALPGWIKDSVLKRPRWLKEAISIDRHAADRGGGHAWLPPALEPAG
jgi:hypothetical protein